jgi:CspA family cold shock protein
VAQQGTVKFFNFDKGYGFIKPDNGGPDVFVHVSALQTSGIDNLNEGERIAFDIEPDKKGKGPKAVNLASAS